MEFGRWGDRIKLLLEFGRYLDGNDVPDVPGNDISGNEIDLILGVRLMAGGAEVAGVGVVLLRFGGFDLDAQEVSVVLDGEVVAR